MFVKLEREEHLRPFFGQHYVIEGMCHLCEVVCLCGVYVLVCLGVCMRETAAASIPHLPTYLGVFDRFPAVWWPIHWSVAHIKWSHSLSGNLIKLLCWPGREWCIGLQIFWTDILKIAKLGNHWHAPAVTHILDCIWPIVRLSCPEVLLLRGTLYMLTCDITNDLVRLSPEKRNQ